MLWRHCPLANGHRVDTAGCPGSRSESYPEQGRAGQDTDDIIVLRIKCSLQPRNRLCSELSTEPFQSTFEQGTETTDKDEDHS